MGILDRFATLLTGQSFSNITDSEQQNSWKSSSLFTCRRCEKTFIAIDMETCPYCQTSVEEIPDEVELGFKS